MEQAVYRIIDANFNRAREGCRVVEEYCRFYLNDPTLSARAKQIRHRISTIISNFDQDRMIAGRDSRGDVGRAMKIPGQMTRIDLDDCLLAAAKRIPEALRAMAETCQSIIPGVYEQLEEIRFDCYNLEKDIILRQPAKKFENVSLYVLINVTPEMHDDKYSRLIDQCIEGGADCLQLRAKGLEARKIYDLSRELVKKCSASGVISIINDRADIAIACDADGFHLGQNDLPVELAMKQIKKPMIIGLSTHNPDQLAHAIETRPHYVGLGPAFKTTTKPHEPVAGINYIEYAVNKLADTGIGHAAIGGIDSHNINSVIKAGAKTIAVSSAVINTRDPVSACRNLKKSFTHYL